MRWIQRESEEPLKEEDLTLPNGAMLVEDYRGGQLLLFSSLWAIGWTEEHNKGLRLLEFGGATF